MFLTLTGEDVEPRKIHCNMLHATHMEEFKDHNTDISTTYIYFVDGTDVQVVETVEEIYSKMREYERPHR